MLRLSCTHTNTTTAFIEDVCRGRVAVASVKGRPGCFFVFKFRYRSVTAGGEDDEREVNEASVLQLSDSAL